MSSLKVVISRTKQWIPEDVKSILTGAAIAAGGAFLTYLAENLGKLDFGQWTPFVAGMLMIVINAIRKYFVTSKYAVTK